MTGRMDNIPAGGCDLPDLEQRLLIEEELDRNVLVEAAAGTGKTTSMIRRMVALLRGGKCGQARNMAAVTFTRKSAAELRSRFQVELEKAVRESEGEERDNLQRALSDIDHCFVGTIHSFCARLLRERPVEAGVHLSFDELDDEEDRLLREEAWEEYSARTLAAGDGGRLEELNRLGLDLSELAPAFLRFCDYPDVDSWPVSDTGVRLPDMEVLKGEVEDYVRHMRELWPRLPEDEGTDRLMPEYRRLPRTISHYEELERPDQIMEVMALFDRGVRQTQREWMKEAGFTREEAKAEMARWEAFREGTARPALRAWREYRYGPVLGVLHEAREIYDGLRKERGLLNFQDLLMLAASLLRYKPHIRRYFGRRYTHLLVDEFQDTDPIQAEVMLLLTASDPGERDWRRCRPRPGSLFVVGDPKQSIFRFRRADIVTYNEVKKILGEEGDGLLVRLYTNFRATAEVIEWVNHVFGPDGPRPEDDRGRMLRFPGEGTEEAPAYVRLVAGREDGNVGELAGLYELVVPQEISDRREALEHEAGAIAAFIRLAVDSGTTVRRSQRQLEEGRPEELGPGDFLIITRNRTNLGVYARRLQEYGIPHRVTGGSALNEVEELRLLHLCLEAVAHPDDPVSLVAVLRSPLFGISDRELYAFKKAGGYFNYRSPIPEELESPGADDIGDAFDKLRVYAHWLNLLPAAAAVENILSSLGLPALAGYRPGGEVEVGSLYKAVELLRHARRYLWSTAQLVDYLGQLVEMEQRYDGISARSEERPAVRVMNLHKVKGLEAPVVFLADPSGESEHDVELHIDRSGDRILGYMAIYGRGSNYHSPLLAHPRGWEELSGRERLFDEAERLRLRYVAATRSGSATIITQREPERANARNPWRYFRGYVDRGRELACGHGQVPAAETAGPLHVKEVESARASTGSCLASARGATYDARGAKEYALSLPRDSGGREGIRIEAGSHPEAPAPREGEHGVEWGTVIHILLQLAMEKPGADLLTLAAAALAENGLDPGLAGHAVDTALSVISSPLWNRARASGRCLVEVPFGLLLEEGVAVPIILRGVIDLIFEEEDGWVLADYKTDRTSEKDLDYLAERYLPQVRLYADIWRESTGEDVKELVLYFTAAGLQVSVDSR